MLSISMSSTTERIPSISRATSNIANAAEVAIPRPRAWGNTQ